MTYAPADTSTQTISTARDIASKTELFKTQANTKLPT